MWNWLQVIIKCQRAVFVPYLWHIDARNFWRPFKTNIARTHRTENGLRYWIEIHNWDTTIFPIRCRKTRGKSRVYSILDTYSYNLKKGGYFSNPINKKSTLWSHVNNFLIQKYSEFFLQIYSIFLEIFQNTINKS